MKVEIWSDVMCPFCYIGKRRFEEALNQFEHRAEIEVIWRSFQLQPQLQTQPNKNSIEQLAESKGWSMDYARQATSHVTEMAKSVGLEYDLEHAVVANSFDAHRLSHFATSQHKGNELEEVLFKAYFTEGKNTADHATLIDLAVSVGLNADDARRVLSSDAYTTEVRNDMRTAAHMGVNGVPFFVFNERYAVSGAQGTETFVQVLEQAWNASGE